MKKNYFKIGIEMAVVLVCTFLCMILLMAEPTNESGKSFFLILVASKAAAIVCGGVALAVAGLLKDDMKGVDD